MIVDAHLHVWRARPDHPEPAASTSVSPCSDVPIELVKEYMAEHQVRRVILVQPLYPGEDNSYVADCVSADPDCFAAVCVVNPRKAQAAESLGYWGGERNCRGLRLRPLVPEETACFGDPSTFPLWEKARELGTVISLLIGADHLPTAASLAERFPEVAMVIDHMGQPNIGEGVGSPSFQALLDLSRYPQVFVKVSGYYYYSQQKYPYADCWDLFRALYARFGPRRLLWGSDFPHVLLHAGYRRTLLLQQRAYSFLTQEELGRIMGENAAELYWAPAQST